MDVVSCALVYGLATGASDTVNSPIAAVPNTTAGSNSNEYSPDEQMPSTVPVKFVANAAAGSVSPPEEKVTFRSTGASTPVMRKANHYNEDGWYYIGDGDETTDDNDDHWYYAGGTGEFESPGDIGDPMPVGSALLPLLMLALTYAAFITYRRNKTA